MISEPTTRSLFRGLIPAVLIALLAAACGAGSSEAGAGGAIASTSPTIELIDEGEASTTCTAPDPTATTLTIPVPTTATSQATSSSTPATTAATTVPPKPTTQQWTRALEVGVHGTDVEAAQQQLLRLGYWLPEATGEFDEPTRHAVVAFQKVNELERDGGLAVDELELLMDAERPTARSIEGRVIEVDIQRQVVLVAADGEVEWALDTSTGVRPGLTPTGSYSVYREIDGIRVSALGRLYRPKYVVRGVAFHGYPEVPPHPASHGCIRLTNDAMDLVWSLDLAPIGTEVLIYDD